MTEGDGGEFPAERTVWVTTNSAPHEETFHVDEECHLLADENGWTRSRSYQELPDEATVCGHCGGTIDRGTTDDEYTSYAKKLRHGDLDATDIVDPIETPEPESTRARREINDG